MIKNVDDILGKISLVDIVREYVDLKRQGVNYVGNSPWTEEKTPSFTVSPSKGIYKCFSSDKGGASPAKFLMDLKGISFPEAMLELSAKSGVPIEYDEGVNGEVAMRQYKEKSQKQKSLQATTQDVIDILKKNLISPNIDYAGKVYTQETIEKWNISTYAGNLISSSNMNTTPLKELGIIKSNERGENFDTLQKRVIFPIRHVSGYFEGFTARATLDTQKSKYVNSDTSPLYDKSKSVFGLFEAQKSIRDKGFVYLTEGATDVILLDQNGVSNAVCTCGTALSADQVKKIAMYTDRVIVLRDSDKAGSSAAERDIEVITNAQLQASVCFLPAKEDPASFVVKQGADAFKQYVDDNTVDGIIWRITKLGDKKDPFKKALATDIAARLISVIQSERIREEYVKELASKIGITLKVMADAVNTIVDSRLTKKKKLSDQQEEDKLRYGIYSNNNKLYDYRDTELSNFTINPVFLVRSEEKSYRVFEMVNDMNISMCIQMNSDDMISLSSFRKGTEMYGNFIFEGQDKEFIKLRRKIYSDMEKVYQLKVLGYVQQSKVYAWGNGITTPTGQFIEVDSYGRVQYDKFGYYVPAFSKINTQELVNEVDEADYEKKFIYSNKGDYTATRLHRDFHNYFNANANIGLAFYIATVYKDYFQKVAGCFPLLNLFGPAGSGKSTMSKFINCLFGIPVPPINCITATWSSFFRRPGQTANAVNVYEEYSDKVDKERADALKGFYDGFARQLAKSENSNKNRSMPVHSSIILVGQILPTHDPALLKRCLTVFFKEITGRNPVKKDLDKWFVEAEKGHYSSITAILHAQRDQMIAYYEANFDEHKRFLVDMFGKSSIPDTRIITSYSMMATVLIGFMLQNNIPFKTADIYDDFYMRMKQQNVVNEGATEILEFWQTLSWLMDTNSLSKDLYAVESYDSIKVDGEEGKKTVVDLGSSKKVLFLKLNHVHKEYLIAAKKQGIARTLDANSIKYYLKINPAYIGETIKKHNNKTMRFMAFNADNIPNVDFETTNYVPEIEPDWTRNTGEMAKTAEFDLFSKNRPEDLDKLFTE